MKSLLKTWKVAENSSQDDDKQNAFCTKWCSKIKSTLIKVILVMIICNFFIQVILLEEGWRELFLLGASQWSMPLEIAPILSAAGMHVDTTPPETIVDVMATVRMIQETVNKFKAANVDSTEYACLKAIVLFKPSK